MHLKFNIIFISLLAFVSNVHAQNNKAVYLEAGGSGLVGTLNFDCRLKSNQAGLRLGVGASPKFTKDLQTGKTKSGKGAAGLFLVGVNTFFDPEYSKSTGNNIELGANVLFAPKNSYAEKAGTYKGKSRIIPSLNIGFRKQHLDEPGLIWRISYTPYFLDGKIRQWGGASIGYQF